MKHFVRRALSQRAEHDRNSPVERLSPRVWQVCSSEVTFAPGIGVSSNELWGLRLSNQKFLIHRCRIAASGVTTVTPKNCSSIQEPLDLATIEGTLRTLPNGVLDR